MKSSFMAVMFAGMIVLTGCGENPHVLGQNPDQQLPVVVNPDGDGGSPGTVGDKKSCKEEVKAVELASRALTEEERSRYDVGAQGAIAVVISESRDSGPRHPLPPIRDARLYLNTNELASAGQTDIGICLVNRDLCVATEVREITELDLLSLFNIVELKQLLLAEPVLVWQVQTEGRSYDVSGVLRLEFIVENCDSGKKEGDKEDSNHKKDDHKKEDPKNGKEHHGGKDSAAG